MDNNMKQVMKEIMIMKEPVNSLVECLSCYTKLQLTDIGKVRGTSIPTKLKKEEIVELLAKDIIETLEEEFLYSGMEYLSQFIALCTNTTEENPEEEIDVYSILKFRALGYVFFFFNKKEQSYTPVVPNEILHYVLEFMKTEDKMNQVAKNEELILYLRALSNLYGVYEKKQFCNVWNAYHEEKISENQLDEFIKKVVPFQIGVWEDDDKIVHQGFQSQEVYQSLWEEVKEKPYYMPTKFDIAIAQMDSIHTEGKEYKNLYSFLESRAADPYAMDELLIHLEALGRVKTSQEEIFRLLNYYEVTLKDTAEVARFMKLFVVWRNNLRTWENRGFKNVESGQENIVINKNKIGRNEPCICGSGKKYKFCCGRN